LKLQLPVKKNKKDAHHSILSLEVFSEFLPDDFDLETLKNPSGSSSNDSQPTKSTENHSGPSKSDSNHQKLSYDDFKPANNNQKLSYDEFKLQSIHEYRNEENSNQKSKSRYEQEFNDMDDNEDMNYPMRSVSPTKGRFTSHGSPNGMKDILPDDVRSTTGNMDDRFHSPPRDRVKALGNMDDRSHSPPNTREDRSKSSPLRDSRVPQRPLSPDRSRFGSPPKTSGRNGGAPDEFREKYTNSLKKLEEYADSLEEKTNQLTKAKKEKELLTKQLNEWNEKIYSTCSSIAKIGRRIYIQ